MKGIYSFSEIFSNIFSLCKGTLCVIGVVEAGNTEHQTILANVYDRYHKDGKFTFLWTSCQEADQALCTKFGVEEKPRSVIYNMKKEKVAQTELNEEALSASLNRALSGDLSYTKLKTEL